jgi:hypothetical protein
MICIEKGNHSQVGFLEEISHKHFYKLWVIFPKKKLGTRIIPKGTLPNSGIFGNKKNNGENTFSKYICKRK